MTCKSIDFAALFLLAIVAGGCAGNAGASANPPDAAGNDAAAGADAVGTQSLSPVEALALLDTEQCKATAICTGGDPTACAAIARNQHQGEQGIFMSIVAEFAAGRLKYDAARMAACSAEAQADCSIYFQQNHCWNMVFAELKVGQACGHGHLDECADVSECKSSKPCLSTCEVPAPVTGTVGVGQACAENAKHCDSGLFCGVNHTASFQGFCDAGIPAGEPCTGTQRCQASYCYANMCQSGEQIVASCQKKAGEICVFDPSSSSLFKYVDAGQPCAGKGVGITNLCKIGLACNEKTSHCQAPATIGTPCTADSTCLPTHVCRYDTHVCGDLPTLNEPCSNTCVWPYLCSGAHICGSGQDDGTACTQNNDCRSGGCSSGTCQKDDCAP